MERTETIAAAAKALVERLEELDHERYNEFLDDDTWALVARLKEALDQPTH